MAATVVAPQDVLGAYVSESATQMTTLTWSAVDITNTNSVTMTGRKLLLLFRNDDVGAVTITISSSADPYGRSADVTAFSIAAGAYAARTIDASDADMKFAAINL
jgi:hypothetical protein